MKTKHFHGKKVNEYVFTQHFRTSTIVFTARLRHLSKNKAKKQLNWTIVGMAVIQALSIGKFLHRWKASSQPGIIQGWMTRFKRMRRIKSSQSFTSWCHCDKDSLIQLLARNDNHHLIRLWFSFSSPWSFFLFRNRQQGNKRP